MSNQIKTKKKGNKQNTSKGANNKPYVKKQKKPYDPEKSKNFRKQNETVNEAKKKAANVKVTKRKMSVTRFELKRESFLSGMTLVLSNLPEKISNLFRGSEYSHVEMTRKIVDVLTGHVPNFETRENVLWEFKISANKVTVKTDEYCGFGWVTRSIKDETALNGFRLDYTFYINVFGDNFAMETKLLNAGFKKENK